jgi:hypothetical protein
MSTNRRETGARKLQPDHRTAAKDQDAALPKKPAPYGLTEPVDDVEEKTRHSDCVKSWRGIGQVKGLRASPRRQEITHGDGAGVF